MKLNKFSSTIFENNLNSEKDIVVPSDNLVSYFGKFMKEIGCNASIFLISFLICCSIIYKGTFSNTKPQLMI